MGEVLRTKVIASLGPASYPSEVMEELMKAGVYMFRNNFSHMPYDEYRRQRELVRGLNEKLGTSVLMQADLQGPHIRIGKIADEGILLQERQTYWFSTTAGQPEEFDIPINDATIHQFVQVGQPISFLNGFIEGEVTEVQGHRIAVRMTNSGTLKSNKAINLPETQLDSCLTEKDLADLQFLVEEGVDWIALSFVSRKEEVEKVREIIGDRPIKIMSKIERQSALGNAEEIIAASDAIMVARGDLGIEIPMEEVPFVQKDLIDLSHYVKKPAVVATQMLYSLVHSQRPTRAEVSDVSGAVLERADALLLSDETTEGVDPVNAVKTMMTIIERAEQHMYGEKDYFSV
ncbi:MAG: pyruvate kinase [bacterium]